MTSKISPETLRDAITGALEGGETGGMNENSSPLCRCAGKESEREIGAPPLCGTALPLPAGLR